MLLASPISYKMNEAGSCCLSSTDEVPGDKTKLRTSFKPMPAGETYKSLALGEKNQQ